MRFILTPLCFLSVIASFSQSLSDKYLHYRTYYYWDTTLYEINQAYYYEMDNGKIAEKEYPVLQYLYTRILSDTPLVTKDTFQRRDWSQYPYKYVKDGKNIYLQYFDLGKKKLQLHLEYNLEPGDTVEGLAEKGSLDSENGISVGNFSRYLGEAIVEINSRKFTTYHFLEDHDESGACPPGYYTKEVFLEQKTLIPIKFVVTEYDSQKRRNLLYSSVTLLTTSSNILANYTNKTTEDLVLYQNKTTVWTEKQKQVFLAMFPADMKQMADCILRKLDGEISFFHFEQNRYFQELVIGKTCE